MSRRPITRASAIANLVAAAVVAAVVVAVVIRLFDVAVERTPDPQPVVTSTTLSVNEDSPGESLPSCPTEDSENCYWDSAAGNGTGRSFIRWDGVTYYAEEAGR